MFWLLAVHVGFGRYRPSGRGLVLAAGWLSVVYVGFGGRLAMGRNGPTGHMYSYSRRFGYGRKFGYGRRLLEWNVEFDCLIIIELHVGCFESPYRGVSRTLSRRTLMSRHPVERNPQGPRAPSISVREEEDQRAKVKPRIEGWRCLWRRPTGRRS
ncbi:hypothetical protein Bca4012_092993 [Brassica carinata]